MVDDRYQDEVRNVLRQLRAKRPLGFTAMLGPRRMARKFAVIAEELGNELAMIEAPDDVAAEHAALVRGLARARTDLEELAGSDGLSWSKRYMAVGDLELAVAELDALRARGYDFSI